MVFLWEHTQLPQLVIHNMQIFHHVTAYNNFADATFTGESQFGNWWVIFSFFPLFYKHIFSHFTEMFRLFPSKMLKQNVSPGAKVTQNQLGSVILSNFVSFWHWSAFTHIATMPNDSSNYVALDLIITISWASWWTVSPKRHTLMQILAYAVTSALLELFGCRAGDT